MGSASCKNVGLASTQLQEGNMEPGRSRHVSGQPSMPALTEEKKSEQWSNWSGSVRCSPVEVVKPRSTGELTKVVREYGRAGRHVRVLGSGHSFTPLVQSNDVLISLE